MKLKRVILDNPIKFHEGRQTQWEQVIPSARYEAPKFALSYDPTSALVSITLGATTKLVHASRVAQMEPADLSVEDWRDIANGREDEALVSAHTARVDKRTKAYRDSVKKAAQAVPGAISSPAKPEE